MSTNGSVSSETLQSGASPPFALLQIKLTESFLESWLSQEGVMCRHLLGEQDVQHPL